MTTTPAKRAEQPAPSTVEDVLIRGDLSKLSEPQRNEYYMRVCQSLGLNPLTRPFDYLTLSGKLVLYAKRDCTDQLRKLNGISVVVVGRNLDGGLLTVHVRATDKSGRSDEDFGVVPFKNAGNEFSANAFMKAVTKAKRRVTLSISGLGLLDETEIPDQPPAPAPHSTTITEAQRARLLHLAEELDADIPQYLEYLSTRWQRDVLKLADIPAFYYEDALAQLERKRPVEHDLETGEVNDATP